MVLLIRSTSWGCWIEGISDSPSGEVTHLLQLRPVHRGILPCLVLSGPSSESVDAVERKSKGKTGDRVTGLGACVLMPRVDYQMGNFRWH